MKNIISGCVILYNPKIEDLENVKTYVSKVSRLYVYDNSEKKSNENFFVDFENVKYFWEADNKGLSIRLNQACKQAIKDGYEYLLTMDQDSYFEEKNINQYFESIFNFKNKENVAVYGLEYNENDIKNVVPYFEEKDHLITSASVINLKLYDKIGGFDENLFIDCVDIDYCYAALINGFRNIKFTTLIFQHSLGEPVAKASNFSLNRKKKDRNIHSNTRIYYMYRNALFLEKKYKNELPIYISELKKRTKKAIKNNFKYTVYFFNLIQLCFKAKSDFRNNRMGKIK